MGKLSVQVVLCKKEKSSLQKHTLDGYFSITYPNANKALFDIAVEWIEEVGWVCQQDIHKCLTEANIDENTLGDTIPPEAMALSQDRPQPPDEEIRNKRIGAIQMGTLYPSLRKRNVPTQR